jgi:hypothetical protein
MSAPQHNAEYDAGRGHAYQRVTTVRMTEEQAVEVELVARVLGISTSELIRTAIAEYLAKRKSEVEFRQRLARRIEQDRRILDRLDAECNCCCDQTTARLVVCPVHPRTRVTPPEVGTGGEA